MRWFLAALLSVASLQAVELSPRTLREFQRYMDKADADMRARATRPTFLWAADNPGRREAIATGQLLVEPYTGQAPLDVPDGLVYDWVGAAFIPGARLADFNAVIRDYGSYARHYAPEVVDAYLIKRESDLHFQGHMRLHKKKVISVFLDADFDVTGIPIGPNRFQHWSRSTRIAEVHNAGRSDEKIQSPDTGFGFLWRLHSYWQAEETPEGLFIELRSISLTRDIPTGLGWAVKPMVTTMPRESLETTIADTRKAVLARLKK